MPEDAPVDVENLSSPILRSLLAEDGSSGG